MERQKYRKNRGLVTDKREFPRFGCIVWAKTSAKPILLRLPGRETSVFTSPSPGRGRNRSLRRPGRAGEAPGGPKTGPRAAQEPPRAPQEPPRAGQSGPGGPPGGPQEGPKRAPKGPLGGQGRPGQARGSKSYFLDPPEARTLVKYSVFLGGPSEKEPPGTQKVSHIPCFRALEASKVTVWLRKCPSKCSQTEGFHVFSLKKRDSTTLFPPGTQKVSYCRVF